MRFNQKNGIRAYRADFPHLKQHQNIVPECSLQHTLLLLLWYMNYAKSNENEISRSEASGECNEHSKWMHLFV